MMITLTLNSLLVAECDLYRHNQMHLLTSAPVDQKRVVALKVKDR